MNTFYDCIFSQAPSEYKKYLNGIPVVQINNVAEYFFSEMAKNKDQFYVNDFPCVKPPFYSFWMEVKNNKLRNINQTFRSYKSDIFKDINEWGAYFYPYISRDKGLILNKYCIELFLKVKKEINIIRYITYSFDDLGKIKDISLHGNESFKNNNIQLFETVVSIFLLPFFLALSFMHCKNVTIVDIKPPEKLNKKRQKRNKPPLITYKTLNIEPMKTILKKEGNIKHNGLKKALHICRGHFKDYSQGKGLFGKYQGLYWWDMHTRGDIKEGIVAKDYNVNPPKEAGDRP